MVKIYSLDGNNFGHRNFSYDVIDNLLHTTHLSSFCWVSADTGY
jgi:hypothetical protein